MTGFKLVLGIWLLLRKVPAESACLDNAIPSGQRRNLTGPGGQSYPVGLWLNDWAAGYDACLWWMQCLQPHHLLQDVACLYHVPLQMNDAQATSAVLRILIEERLGYSVVDQGPGPGTLNAFYALMGCTSPLNLTDRGCALAALKSFWMPLVRIANPSLGLKIRVTYSHINFETWAEGYTNEWDEMQVRHTSIAPVNAGSMGYVGKTSLFFARRILEDAYYRVGTALDYFRGSSPWTFFDSLDSINRNLLYPCNQTRFMLSKPNEDYLSYTGDADGLQRTPSGELVAICPDGYFWLPPSCRDDASKCVPYITGGLGWQLDEVMQKATAFYMPLALAVAQSGQEAATGRVLQDEDIIQQLDADMLSRSHQAETAYDEFNSEVSNLVREYRKQARLETASESQFMISRGEVDEYVDKILKSKASLRFPRAVLSCSSSHVKTLTWALLNLFFALGLVPTSWLREVSPVRKRGPAVVNN
eukprot:s107_g18.t1